MYKLHCSGTNGTYKNCKSEMGEIDLRKNSDFDPKQLEKTPDDFIFWKYYLDIMPPKDIDPEKYINQISRLIKELNTKNMRAVASCDFEDEVPYAQAS